MKYLFITEHEIGFDEKKNIPKEAITLGRYSKEKLLELVEEFPELEHPLPIYRFLYWDGTVYTTFSLAQFARDNNLEASSLSRIHKHARFTYRGLIKAPDNLEQDLIEYHKEITQKKVYDNRDLQASF